jgi:hypothetical protein
MRHGCLAHFLLKTLFFLGFGAKRLLFQDGTPWALLALLSPYGQPSVSRVFATVN